MAKLVTGFSHKGTRKIIQLQDFGVVNIQRTWQLEHGCELTNIDKGHIVARFYSQADYMNVLNGGSWTILLYEGLFSTLNTSHLAISSVSFSLSVLSQILGI